MGEGCHTPLPGGRHPLQADTPPLLEADTPPPPEADNSPTWKEHGTRQEVTSYPPFLSCIQCIQRKSFTENSIVAKVACLRQFYFTHINIVVI